MAKDMTITETQTLKKCCGKQTNEMETSMEVKQFDHLGYGKCRAPLFFQNVKTDAAITVDIRVINLGAESHLHRKQSWMVDKKKFIDLTLAQSIRVYGNIIQ